jgi:hypothetical protein
MVESGLGLEDAAKGEPAACKAGAGCDDGAGSGGPPTAAWNVRAIAPANDAVREPMSNLVLNGLTDYRPVSGILNPGVNTHLIPLGR